MDSAKNGNEYTLMVEFDFSKPINAAIIFDSDEDESNKETNSLKPEKYDGDHQKVTKSLDMPSLDGHNSTTETKYDDVITGLIKKYTCKSTKNCDKKPLKRKSSTASDKIKNKLEKKHMKEIITRHNEPCSKSSNNYKNYQLASFSADSNGPPSNVSNDIRSQSSSCISKSFTNNANEQPKSASIEPKSEPTEDSNPSSYLYEEISSQRNTSTSSLPPYTDNSQTVSICIDQQIEPLRDSWTSPNIVSDGIGNPLDTSTSSSPSNDCNGQTISACIEVKAILIKDSNPQRNLSNEKTGQQDIFSTSNLPRNTDNKQCLSACIEQRVRHPSTSANDVSKEIRNGIDKLGDKLNTSFSSSPPNTDSSCTFTNVSEEIRNQLNTTSSSSPTKTTNTQPVSTDDTSKIQTLQNNDNSVTYDHLKPLLNTVSEHLILIWRNIYSCNDFIKDRSVQNLEFNEELRKKIYNYKIKLFDLSYSTVVNVILPRANDRQFVKDFIDNTVALSKSENIHQTTKDISLLYLEMIHWVQKMKQRITSESVFDHEIMRQSSKSTATKTSGLPEIVKESINPHSTHNYTCSIRPPETERPPPWITRSNPPPPYTNNPVPLYNYNLPPSYTNKPPPSSYTSNIPSQYINTMPPQTIVNHVITPEQTKVINSTYSEHQLSTKPMQKKEGRLNKKQQVTVAEVARREVNCSDRRRHEIYSPNITQVYNFNNNHNVNVSSNRIGGTHQNYQPTYCAALPNPNHAQSAYCISTNNNPYPRATAEMEYQKLLRASKPRNLPNNNTSSKNQNHCYKPNDASSQGINNYPNNACLNQANNIQQEPDRSSISRDSGFYSPRDFEQETSTSPLITHVTSLNPDAVNIIKGNCFVCGKNTNQKCIGCYAIYYCSYGCQNFDWRNHMAYCNTNQEIRKLLFK